MFACFTRISPFVSVHTHTTCLSARCASRGPFPHLGFFAKRDQQQEDGSEEDHSAFSGRQDVLWLGEIERDKY